MSAPRWPPGSTPGASRAPRGTTRTALSLYSPTIATSIGTGAAVPVLALHARELGASVGEAAFVVAAMGLGAIAGALPASTVIARVGERAILVWGGVATAAAMLVAATAQDVRVLTAAMFFTGLTMTGFLQARQGHVMDSVPLHRRARALALLGAAHRVGLLVGPLLGAAAIHLSGLRSVFWIAVALSTAGALLAHLTVDRARSVATEPPERTLPVMWRERRTLATLGSTVVLMGMSRSVRDVVVPLWADHIGLSPATTSLVLAGAMAAELVLTYPGGHLTDVVGRTPTAAAFLLGTAAAALLLPLTSGLLSFAAVVTLVGAGNGLGSGIVMTLGADVAPIDARAQFLGAWRLCVDTGQAAGPLAVGVLVQAASLATTATVFGSVLAAGSAWAGLWVRRADVRRGEARSNTVPETLPSRPTAAA